MKRLLLFALLGCLLLAGPAAAQFGDSALTGGVVDQNGDPMRGAVVQARQVDGGLRVESICDNKGVYLITDLPAGRYQVVASLTGHGNSKKNVTLDRGQRLQVNFVLGAVNKDGFDREYQPTLPGIGPMR
ncbi:MAG: carboxypeptidase-like regulatory domain-containing protein [Thermodesulfobacteriota bacterium]